ncbi:basic helix-loop-helix (bHLH) DNA-bindingsuperfamily protein [Striga asiatica]|uniref:Basic helix-loop-helix (BHLH) DNA-bindingsuperfamily protein n=1 Tax=Striga asiatica TaxID=4170 RepID=A0A5A7QT62_STRAF|nr:basic helix-loop-helix (bHLH) DNA-bindingsuperfamily protein [Striga asiatica]
MEEQVQGGVCGGNLWVDRSTKFFLSSSINGPKSFGWPSHDRATGSLSGDSAGSVLHEPSPENVSIVSTLEMMGINLSTTLDDDNWNQDLIHESQKSQENYSHNLQASSAPLGLVDPRMNIDGQNLGFQYNTNSFDYKLPLLQTLLDVGPNRQSIPNIHQAINYGPSQNYVSRAEICPTLPNNVQETRHANDRFEFANNYAPFWNASTSSFAASSQARLIRPSSLHNSRPNFHILDSKQHNYQEAGQGSKKAGHKLAAKRPPAESPSPLSAFKVRKEKLGDRITALQQLVSPFGKTDTASVLHEAIEYIKFLHDQVSVLSTPYLKNGSPQLQYQQAEDKIKDAREQIKDLKSRGLCLVPISTTFPVATETNTYFWTPTFGGCFR